MCAFTTVTFKNMKTDSPTRTVLINKCQPKSLKKNDALWSSSDLAPSPLSSRLCKRYPMTQIKQHPSGVSQILGRVWFLTWFTLFLGAGTAAIELYTKLHPSPARPGKAEWTKERVSVLANNWLKGPPETCRESGVVGSDRGCIETVVMISSYSL